MTDHTQRFSGRAENYVKYRPSYPSEIIGLLQRECGLQPDWVIADVGAGPGNLARLFLEHGNHVYGIEPNADMRAAGAKLLSGDARFTSVNGTAEATGLAGTSVDMVTAGQAFHWFDAVRAGQEFRRILRPPRWTVLVWNERRTDTTPFLVALEQALQQYGSFYAESRQQHAMDDEKLSVLFAPDGYKVATFENRQRFDCEGLLGRVSSASYAPMPGQPGYEELERQLREIFQAYVEDGVVAFEYETRVYYGRL